MNALRLLIDPPQPGVINMARDEALLQAVSRDTAPPTLRMYRWDEPTISLGYFQKYADYEALPAPAGELPVVRRTTGGGAILHDQEWTYSIALPTGHDLISPRPTALYERVHHAIIAALELLAIRATTAGVTDDSAAHRGPFFCFERRHCIDVVIGNDKLAGSAQRRTPTALLQHGSLIVDNRFAQQRAATIRAHVAIDTASLLQPLLDALRTSLDATWEPADWTAAELADADAAAERYGGADWTRKY